MLKKFLLFAFFVAIGVSPLLPRVFADSGASGGIIAEAVWDYNYFRVKRLSLDSVSGPYDFNDTVFVTSAAASCQYPDSCDLVDVLIFDDGKSFEIEGVDERVTEAFSHTAQDGRFIYRVPSEDEASWGVVYEYDETDGSVSELAPIARDEDDLAFMTFATDGDRVYFATLHTDEDTGEIESELSVYDYGNGYSRSDFTYQLSAPWQEIVDVQDGLALVRFQFSGGFEQLWLVDQTARQMEAIPDTWTELGSDIVGAHFLSDGSIRFFRNYRLWRYNPATDSAPTDAGGAYLSWLDESQEAIQIVGDRMAYIDDEDGLYVSDVDGVSKFGVAMDGVFNLDEDAVYFQNVDEEYVGYQFSTHTWETRNYLVTDTFENVLVGIDADQNVWYENISNGYLLSVGYGESPLLSDREHAYWKGIDGKIYEVTFSPVLGLERPSLEAFSSSTSNAVYLVSDDSIWLVPDEAVYFSWFDSWDDVLEISQATIDVYLASHEYKEDLKFAPGTRVKTASNPRVYVVGSDYKLHWMISETVANEIYGSNWNKGIVEVSDTYLWKYATSFDVTSRDDVHSI